ncbi:MAG: FAD-binding oxidoreductase [Bermanella sp.]
MSSKFKVNAMNDVVFECSVNETILDAGARNGFHFESSCNNGQCGSCRTILSKGNVEAVSEQLALSKQDIDDGYILTCCCSPVRDIHIASESLDRLKNINKLNLPCKISSITMLNETVMELVLRLPPKADFNFIEGQYIDLQNSKGVRRSYSIASNNGEGVIRLIIKKVKDGEFSQYLFEDARINDLLRLEGPKGTFYIRDKEEHIVFLVTGTGIAPVLSILSALNSSSNLSNKKIDLYWGNRLSSEFFELPNYSNLNLEVEKVISQPSSTWNGKVGYVQDVFLGSNDSRPVSNIYACGSIKMINAVKGLFKEDSSKIFFDAFLKS